MKSKNQTIRKSDNFRPGSALLVVLGMLAFMLFSGLAFSVYMRQSRLPTSFLRRTATTRQLTKAALAEAIDHIDRAIGNDPHPGIRSQGKAFNADVLDNFWFTPHRVFSGLGTSTKQNGSQQSSATGSYYPKEAKPDETVPTLTLEGLAYLPPNLINEARYYSQRTPTAKWHSFWFDSGRYAYTAFDVSDYFDVNRIQAAKPRAACAAQRISFAHIFEKELHDSQEPGAKEKEWDTFMKKFRDVDDTTGEITYKTYPFVSMADFNIAWGSKTLGDLRCPFYDFVENGRPYADCKEDGGNAEKYRNMTFVTDGWFPTAAGDLTPGTNRKKLDLGTVQPFQDSELNGSQLPRLLTVMTFGGGETPDGYLSKHLSRLGRAQLWDYLDANRVPVSLAVPTLERVPMICGLELSNLPTIKFKTSPGQDSFVPATPAKGWGTRIAKRTYTCTMTLTDAVGAHALAAYPFREHGITDSENFSVDGRVAVFLTLDGQQMSLRPGSANASLHLSRTDMESGNNVTPPKNSVFSFALAKQQVSGNTIAKNSAGPVRSIPLTGKTDGFGQVEFFKVTYEWDQQEVDDGSGGSYPDLPDPNFTEPKQISRNAAETGASFQALNADGSVASEFSDINKFAQAIVGGLNVRANAAIWARVKYNDPDMGDKTVDLVPACLLDDKELNQVDNMGGSSALQGFTGAPYPLLRYDVKMGGQDTLKVAYDLNSDCALAIENPRILVNDPRFNHAPDNWYVLAGTGLTEKDWIDEVANMVGQDGRDSDFYMFTSDAGRMQSVYELAFLPRFTTLEDKTWGVSGNFNPTYRRTALGAQASDAADYDFMWRTYRCYGDPAGTYSADPFEEIGLTCGENGPKVNPYSDSKKVLMAAFANTPHDWRVTATDKKYAVISDSEMKDASAFNKKHAWNAYSSEQTGKLCWDCLEDLAGRLQDKVRDPTVQANAKADDMDVWEYAFANLGWSNDKRSLLTSMDPLDDDDSDLYSVDKKFLYGFWHDCFAARQQLFLIFVRAEPMMMGGGVKGQMPPQLGARAVALVWRDPSATKTGRSGSVADGANPHRTRILFYHQFD